jgi:hypothetical protein
VRGDRLAPNRGGRSRPSPLAAMGAVEDGVRPPPLGDRCAPGERCGRRSRRGRHRAGAAERGASRSGRSPRRAARAEADRRESTPREWCGCRVEGQRTRRGPRRRAARDAARRQLRAPGDPDGAGRRSCRGRDGTSITWSKAHHAPWGGRGGRNSRRPARMHGRRGTGTGHPPAQSPWGLAEGRARG